MTIEYLQKLKNNPTLEYNKGGIFWTIEGLSLNEISQLENLYNNGNPFPKVLRELLFLAGKDCHGISFGGLTDNGATGFEIQQEMQDFARRRMQAYNRTISRPFYVFDLSVSGQYLFIYLDEGDNPQVYDSFPGEDPDDSEWIEILPNNTIKSIIDNKVELIKKGENPY